MKSATDHHGTLGVARWIVRGAVLLAVLLFVGALRSNDASWFLGLWRVIVAGMVAGCWALTVLVARSQTKPGEQGFDFALGLVSVAFGLFSVFGATDEGGSDLFFEIVGPLLVLGGIALVLASAAGKRRAQQWRNTEETNGRSR